MSRCSCKNLFGWALQYLKHQLIGKMKTKEKQVLIIIFSEFTEYLIKYEHKVSNASISILVLLGIVY